MARIEDMIEFAYAAIHTLIFPEPDGNTSYYRTFFPELAFPTHSICQRGFYGTSHITFGSPSDRIKGMSLTATDAQCMSVTFGCSPQVEVEIKLAISLCAPR